MRSYPKMISALEKVKDRATNKSFKLLWEDKIRQLKRQRDLLLMGIGQGDILNGWPEDGAPGEKI